MKTIPAAEKKGLESLLEARENAASTLAKLEKAYEEYTEAKKILDSSEKGLISGMLAYDRTELELLGKVLTVLQKIGNPKRAVIGPFEIIEELRKNGNDSQANFFKDLHEELQEQKREENDRNRPVTYILQVKDAVKAKKRAAAGG